MHGHGMASQPHCRPNPRQPPTGPRGDAHPGVMHCEHAHTGRHCHAGLAGGAPGPVRIPRQHVMLPACPRPPAPNPVGPHSHSARNASSAEGLGQLRPCQVLLLNLALELRGHHLLGLLDSRGWKREASFGANLNRSLHVKNKSRRGPGHPGNAPLLSQGEAAWPVERRRVLGRAGRKRNHLSDDSLPRAAQKMHLQQPTDGDMEGRAPGVT